MRANQRWRLQMFVPEGAPSAGSVQPFVECAMRTIFNAVFASLTVPISDIGHRKQICRRFHGAHGAAYGEDPGGAALPAYRAYRCITIHMCTIIP